MRAQLTYASWLNQVELWFAKPHDLVVSHRSAEVPSRSSRVIVEKPTESRTATDRTDGPHRGSTGEQLVVEPLVVPLAMIALEELGGHETEVTVTQGDETIQDSSLMDRTNRSACALAFGAW